MCNFFEVISNCQVCSSYWTVPVFRLGVPLRCKASKLKYRLFGIQRCTFFFFVWTTLRYVSLYGHVLSPLLHISLEAANKTRQWVVATSLLNRYMLFATHFFRSNSIQYIFCPNFTGQSQFKLNFNFLSHVQTRTVLVSFWSWQILHSFLSRNEIDCIKFFCINRRIIYFLSLVMLPVTK